MSTSRKPLGVKKQTELLTMLRQVLNAASLEHAHFNAWAGDEIADEVPLPKSEKEVNDFIRRRTDRYRHAWIIEPLQKATRLLDETKK